LVEYNVSEEKQRHSHKKQRTANSVFIVFGRLTHLEFITLLGSFTIVRKENVSNSQTQQIRKPLAVIEENKTN